MWRPPPGDLRLAGRCEAEAEGACLGGGVEANTAAWAHAVGSALPLGAAQACSPHSKACMHAAASREGMGMGTVEVEARALPGPPLPPPKLEGRAWRRGGGAPPPAAAAEEAGAPPLPFPPPRAGEGDVAGAPPAMPATPTPRSLHVTASLARP